MIEENKNIEWLDSVSANLIFVYAQNATSYKTYQSSQSWIWLAEDKSPAFVYTFDTPCSKKGSGGKEG